MKLPFPTLQVRHCAGLSYLTDQPLFEATGVSMGFSRRDGGTSAPPYDSLNLGTHVGDVSVDVRENRRRLLAAAGLEGTRLLTLNQVHGREVLQLASGEGADFAAAEALAADGADGVAVAALNVTALLCFADCVPVVVVSPSGFFAVAHAGWRGALAGIPSRVVEALAKLDAQAGQMGISPSDYNGYIGPHIMAECYECGSDLVEQFVRRYGDGCASGSTHLCLEEAVRASLAEAGICSERIASAGKCTACHPDLYFSYRESGGLTGRHGAFAGRKG